MVPTHFTISGVELLLHLARPNPVWPHLEGAAQVRLGVAGDDAYIPSYWRAKAGGPDENGVPTSYYAAVQFVCRPIVVDNPQGKVDILTAQLADMQPEGHHATVAIEAPPYGRMLSGIRVYGWRCCKSMRSSSMTTTIVSITGNAQSTTSRDAVRSMIWAQRPSSVDDSRRPANGARGAADGATPGAAAGGIGMPQAAGNPTRASC